MKKFESTAHTNDMKPLINGYKIQGLPSQIRIKNLLFHMNYPSSGAQTERHFFVTTSHLTDRATAVSM